MIVRAIQTFNSCVISNPPLASGECIVININHSMDRHTAPLGVMRPLFSFTPELVESYRILAEPLSDAPPMYRVTVAVAILIGVSRIPPSIVDFRRTA